MLEKLGGCDGHAASALKMCGWTHLLLQYITPRPIRPEFANVAHVVRTWALSCTCTKHWFAFPHYPCMPVGNDALALVCVLHTCMSCASVFTPQQMVRD